MHIDVAPAGYGLRTPRMGYDQQRNLLSDQQMPKLEFYFAPGTSSMAPHIAVHEIGAPFEARALSFATNDQREAPFRAINPEGKVPVLVIDGRTLTEVAAILFYLARTFPEVALLPKDIEAEANDSVPKPPRAMHPARAGRPLGYAIAARAPRSAHER